MLLVLNSILDDIADENTAAGLKRHIAHTGMKLLRGNLENMTMDVLASHKTGHLFTWNHYFTDNIQKLREDHHRRFLIAEIDEFFGTNTSASKTYCQDRSFDVKTLVNVITQRTLPDMDRYACSKAIDCMKAYYRVGLLHALDSADLI